MKRSDLIGRQIDNHGGDRSLLRQSLKGLGVAFEDAVSRGVELARVGIAVPAQHDRVALDLDLDFGPRFSANLLKDGLVEDDARGIAMPGDLLDEGHCPTSVPTMFEHCQNGSKADQGLRYRLFASVSSFLTFSSFGLLSSDTSN
jgi:hypothetical protein